MDRWKNDSPGDLARCKSLGSHGVAYCIAQAMTIEVSQMNDNEACRTKFDLQKNMLRDMHADILRRRLSLYEQSMTVYPKSFIY